MSAQRIPLSGVRRQLVVTDDMIRGTDDPAIRVDLRTVGATAPLSAPFVASGAAFTLAYTLPAEALLQAHAGAPRTVAAMRRVVEGASLSERREAARRFAARIGSEPDVEGVWLTSINPELLVSVVTAESDLDRDLELRAIFTELIGTLSDGTRAGLELFSRVRGVPDRLSQAEKIA